MDKFIEVFTYKVDYETDKIETEEIAIVSLFKINAIFIAEYANCYAIIVRMNMGDEYCYSLCCDKAKAYETLKELKNKLNGRENG